MPEPLTVHGAATLAGKIIMARRGSKHFDLEKEIREAAEFVGNFDLDQAIINEHWALAEMLALNALTDFANRHPGTTAG